MNELTPKFKTNLDTDFLKLVAIISMTIDHVGSALFSNQIEFRILGRLAFPIFCYCLSVGLAYTKDIKKYLLRIAVVGLISQPFYVLAFYDVENFYANLDSLNIFFSLFINLLGAWAVKEKRWWLLSAVVVSHYFIDFDYGYLGLFLVLIFFLCRNRPTLGAILFLLCYMHNFLDLPNNRMKLAIGDYDLDISVFALLSAPLIFFKTGSGIKIPSFIFYIYYPLHLMVFFFFSLL